MMNSLLNSVSHRLVLFFQKGSRAFIKQKLLNEFLAIFLCEILRHETQKILNRMHGQISGVILYKNPALAKQEPESQRKLRAYPMD